MDTETRKARIEQALRSHGASGEQLRRGMDLADGATTVGEAKGEPFAETHEGVATVETCTVMHDRTGAPERGIAACLLDDGRRTWATTDDPGVMAAMVGDGFIGGRVEVAAGALRA